MVREEGETELHRPYVKKKLGLKTEDPCEGRLVSELETGTRCTCVAGGRVCISF